MLSWDEKFDRTKIELTYAMWAANRYKSYFPVSTFKLLKKPNQQYTIFVENPDDHSPDKEKFFYSEICPAGSSVEITNTRPTNSQEVLLECEKVLSERVSIVTSVRQFYDDIMTEHSDLCITNIERNKNNDLLAISFRNRIKDEQLRKFKKNLEKFGIKEKSLTIQNSINSKRDLIEKIQPNTNVSTIANSSRRKPDIQNLRHVREDDEKWFFKYEQAATGELKPEQVICLNNEARRVFIPSLSGLEIPNLRNYLLTHNEIILEAPLEDGFELFLEKHKLKLDDFASAAAIGRLKLLITQPEERLPISLLKAIEEAAPENIIGRRAASVFAMSHFCERKNKYESHINLKANEIRDYSEKLSRQLDLDPSIISRVLLSPISNYHEALDRLRGSDLKEIPVMIGEDAWAIVKSLLRYNRQPEPLLEFTLGAGQLMSANLFQAELAISRSHEYLHLPCIVVHTLQTFTNNALYAVSGMQRDLQSNLVINPETPVFDFSEIRPLEQLFSALKPGDGAIADSIIQDLSNLPREERKERVLEITDLLRDFGATPTKIAFGEGMPRRYAEISAATIGLILPPIGWMLGFFQIGESVSTWFRDVDRIKRLGPDTKASYQKIEFLQRLRGVAWLSEKQF